MRRNFIYLKDLFLPTLINRKGLSIEGKYLLIESDDWGAIRTPSREALKEMSHKGLIHSDNVYRFDALASEDDLNYLFDLLSKYKDEEGNPPVFTANTIVANPDFEKIKDSNFQQYYYESFLETFKKYPAHENNFKIWKKGISEGFFKPQCHGREHVNVNRWMKEVRSGNEKVLTSFNHGSTYAGYDDYSFMEALDWDEKKEVEDHTGIVNEGLDLFKEIFGYASKSFIAPCYCWDPEIERILAIKGIEWIQGVRKQFMPRGGFKNYEPKIHSFGELNKLNMRYNIRNCVFEPSMSKQKDWVSSCLAKIANAFYWNKPAVITSHRINYVGFIDEKNRDRGLKQLDELLYRITKNWPDIRFISTDQLSMKMSIEQHV